MNEQLSAFLDNEATRDEADAVVNALLRDETLRDSWTRQHWIRTTLRAHSAETPVAVDTGFANRVMAAVSQEAFVESPVESVAPALPRVVPMMRAGRTRRWRGVAGLAAAASVAGIVLLTGNPFVRSGGMSETRTASNAAGSGQTATRTRDASARDQSASSSFGSGGWNNRLADFSSISARPAQVTTVSAGTASASAMRTGVHSGAVADDDADHWSVSDPAVRNELNGYLADHNGMARGYGMSGTTPALVRVATYGQDVTQ